MHGGLGCRRGTRTVPFSVSHALPHKQKSPLPKEHLYFRSAKIRGRTNGFSDKEKGSLVRIDVRVNAVSKREKSFVLRN